MLAFKGHSSPQIDIAATPTITLAKHVRRRYFTTAGGPRTHHPMRQVPQAENKYQDGRQGGVCCSKIAGHHQKHKYYQQTQLLQRHSRE